MPTPKDDPHRDITSEREQSQARPKRAWMKEYSRDTIEAFASLFKGRTDARGYINECIYESVTLKHYENHLTGEANLGIYFLLDNSTCHFAAIDLDEKNFNQAKAIRDELAKNSIPAYIAESKSKGFHIYCFAQNKFKAVDIRRVLHHILKKLDIKTEVFPKQDYHQPDDSDGTKHPGSYINLPSFGYTRPFLSGELKEVPLKIALERIKRVPQEVVDQVLEKLPKEKPKASTKKEAEHPDNEIAVQKLLGNCTFAQYCRDNAATLPEPFWWSMVHSLAVFAEPGRKKIHELSEPYPRYSKEETDKKIKEAERVADKEVGPHTCLFIEKELGFSCPKDCLAKKLGTKAPAGLASKLAAARRGEKAEKRRLTARFDGLVDLVEKDGAVVFLTLKGSSLDIRDTVEIDNYTFTPPAREYLPFVLPRASEVLRYYESDRPETLFIDLIAYFQLAAEVPMSAHYKLLAWWATHTYFYDRFDYSPILALIGLPERGKTRLGKALVNISYRGVETETLREANLFRWSNDLGATLLLDVKDIWRKAEREKSEDILLKRYEKGAKVGRVLYPERGPFKDTMYFDIYGPTVIATNEQIHHILDTRCLAVIMPKSKMATWPKLDGQKASRLKERLVAFRAKHMLGALPDYEKPPLGRLGDILQPLGVIMRLISPEEDEEFTQLTKILWVERLEQKSQSREAKVILAIDALFTAGGSSKVAIADIARVYNEGLPDKERVSPETIGRRVRHFGFETARLTGGPRAANIDAQLLTSLKAEYGLDFSEDTAVPCKEPSQPSFRHSQAWPHAQEESDGFLNKKEPSLEPSRVAQAQSDGSDGSLPPYTEQQIKLENITGVEDGQ
jgi:hypothetical protein